MSSYFLDAVDNLVPFLHKKTSIEMFLKTYKAFKSDLEEVQEQTELVKKIKLIGRGTFGDVYLVRHKISQKVFAVKSVSKSIVDKYFWVERDIMAFIQSQWLVQLCCSFQDDNFLYMVMDYMPGGDLSILMKKGCMSKDVAKFYIAEVVLALEALHAMCYIHFDIKPENVLLDQNGHIKLADFGVSIKTDCMGIANTSVIHGTLLYLAPEVLEFGENDGSLERDCDWWSVGVLLYEMLFGHTPFASHSMLMTVKKIKNYKDYLMFPKDKQISAEAKDIICCFLTDSMNRLGSVNTDDIKQHPFFRNDQWTFNTIHQTVAPIVPELSQYNGIEDFSDMMAATEDLPFTGNQIQFLGFTYFKDKKLFSLSENPSDKAPESTKEKATNKPTDARQQQDGVSRHGIKKGKKRIAFCFFTGCGKNSLEENRRPWVSKDHFN